MKEKPILPSPKRIGLYYIPDHCLMIKFPHDGQINQGVLCILLSVIGGGDLHFHLSKSHSVPFSLEYSTTASPSLI